MARIYITLKSLSKTDNYYVKAGKIKLTLIRPGQYRMYTRPKYGIILGLCDGNINHGIHAQLLTRNMWLHKIKRIK